MADVNRSTTNRGNASHQLINFSWRNIILFLYSIWKKYICIYKAKQKLAHQFISIWWYYFWYTTCRQFISILSINITKNCIYPITLNNEYKKKTKKTQILQMLVGHPIDFQAHIQYYLPLLPFLTGCWAPTSLQKMPHPQFLLSENWDAFTTKQ